VLCDRLALRRQDVAVRTVAANGPGNVVLARVRANAITAVFTTMGEQGKPAERVAEECAALVQAYLEGDAPVCEHLADQLLLPLALGAGGTFRTGPPSAHARTNADIIARFLGDRFAFSPADGAVHVKAA
jgi:RNA 3'-terminal phosphate cyclase (ATP)